MTTAPRATAEIDISRPLNAVLREVERLCLQHALTAAGGNRTRAAELLGLRRETVARKLADYQVKVRYELG